ncbi:helix-turn-helix domain-containing protein [Virgibacillus halodenitrificans]|uniref:helix-turn-helix domain-containing protein n=1 Tax=Virgibacillus halodenitrificans TaxID=1482 RepID=UPI0003131597|nr:XRE family transcriptional regulator [Virgibacillus halodenitrificans]
MNSIGEKVRDLRSERRMTLKQVSEKTGLSISFISQVETNKCSVTLESLMKISEALNVKPSYFFPKEANTSYKKSVVISKQPNVEENESAIDFAYKDLSGKFSDQRFTPTLITLEPRKEGVTPMSHSGQEFIYILEGTLTIIMNDDLIDLKPGESIHMESTIPHNWMNLTDSIIKFLYVSAN